MTTAQRAQKEFTFASTRELVDQTNTKRLSGVKEAMRAAPSISARPPSREILQVAITPFPDSRVGSPGPGIGCHRGS
jgi:hypothetical protein